MKKWFIALFLFWMTASCLWAKDEKEPKDSIFRVGYFSGTGGSVGTKGSMAGGVEYEFFRDDYNHALSVSFDLLNDRTASLSNRLLLSALANFRWYAGKEAAQGFYVAGGIGIASPFGLNHGTGSFAYEGSAGYAFSSGMLLEFRYLGRRSQTVVFNGNAFSTNNAFYGGFAGFRF